MKEVLKCNPFTDRTDFFDIRNCFLLKPTSLFFSVSLNVQPVETGLSLKLWILQRLLLDAIVLPSSGQYGGRGGPDYPGIRTTEGKLRGIGNMQKALRVSKVNFLKGKTVPNTNNNVL